LGVAPVSDANVNLIADLTAGLQGQIGLENWVWRSFNDYLLALEKRGLPNNAAVLVSHGPIRIMAMGMDNRPPTQEELRYMQSILREAMEDGGYGLSTGLIYPPHSFSDTDELIALNREVTPFDGIFVVHQRDEGYLIREAFQELLEVSRTTGVHLHISHLQAYGQVNWPLMDDVLEQADLYIASGGKVTWDRYPYLAGCTVLSAVLPDWTFSEGTKNLVENLKNPSFRERIREDFKKGLDEWNNRSISVGWENIYVSAVTLEKNRWMEGRDCSDLANETGKDPIDLVCDLLAEEDLAVTMISFYGSYEVMDKILNHPNATVGSDGIFLGRPHPRLYGTFPRFIQRYVREKSLMSFSKAIRKLTSFPAEILGLEKRGQLKEGYWADIVLLDLDKIADKATYEDPIQYPDGIHYVFVNGELVVENGEYSGNLPGQVLRKTRQ
jgi:N-acyl-D-amino-acid deacylase